MKDSKTQIPGAAAGAAPVMKLSRIHSVSLAILLAVPWLRFRHLRKHPKARKAGNRNRTRRQLRRILPASRQRRRRRRLASPSRWTFRW